MAVNRMKGLTSIVAAGMAAGALLSGCASVQGGDMKCKDFTSASDEDQQTAVSEMLKDRKGNEPAQLEITGTRLSVQTYCQTIGREDSKIMEAPQL